MQDCSSALVVELTDGTAVDIPAGPGEVVASVAADAAVDRAAAAHCSSLNLRWRAGKKPDQPTK